MKKLTEENVWLGVIFIAIIIVFGIVIMVLSGGRPQNIFDAFKFVIDMFRNILAFVLFGDLV